MVFRIAALDRRHFDRFFAMAEDELTGHLGVRVTATSRPGFPCRVSLVDAEVGETLILLHYRHQAGTSPYRASHAVFVRERAEQAHPAAGEVPELLRSRTLSLRAFDERAMIVAVDLVEGADLEPALDRLLADPAAAYVHIHYAKAGCYAACAHRA